MRAIVLDQTFEVGLRARRMLGAVGIGVECAGSAAELGFLLGTDQRYAIAIINLAGSIAALDVEPLLRDGAFAGETMVLHGVYTDEATVRLRRLPRTLCALRPASGTQLDELLLGFTNRRGRDVVVDTAQLPRDVEHVHGLVGESPALQTIAAQIKRVAIGDANVCIVGERGSGKELIARTIHRDSDRRDGPFIVLDGPSIAEGAMETHLFGCSPDSAGGEHREGALSLAENGTLFIDELSVLGLSLQDKLLRALKVREFFPVGSARPIRFDVRIMTATTRDPIAAVSAGILREELFYRLAVVTIPVPTLGERASDIPLLVNHFVRKHAALHGKRITGVTPAAMGRLVAWPWPGNVRELETVVQRAVVMADGVVLGEEELFGPQACPAGERTAPPAPSIAHALTLREVERRHIMRTLEAVRGNRTQAARLLAISVRSLQYKLKAYGRDRASDTATAPPTRPLARAGAHRAVPGEPAVLSLRSRIR